MKVALVHDYIKEYGGAERVLEALHEMWPSATVFTTVYLPEFLGPHKKRFSKWRIKTSFLQYLPYKGKLISFFRIITPFVFSRFALSQYDFIIVSATGAYNPNVITKGEAVQICYCHTPPRYLYGYATARNWKKNKVFNILGEIANHFLRIVDFKSSQNVDYFIANSETVKARIQKFYRKDATIIYPPVDVVTSSQNSELRKKTKLQALRTQSYYLAGGRLARPKHIDLIVRTATKYGLPLKVFGKAFAGYGTELEVLAGPTVELLGEVSDSARWELMRNAKAFISASEDEDFGILPVEALSVGLPVLAYRSGGVVESIIEGKTGLFFHELSVASLKKAIDQFERANIKARDCIKQAERFSKDRFQREIKEFIEAHIA